MPDSFTASNQSIINNDLSTTLSAIAETDVVPLLSRSTTALESLVHMLAKEYLFDDVYETVTLRVGVEYRIFRQQRKFVAVFCPVQIAGVSLNIQGITASGLTLVTGWNIINSPDRSIITVPLAGAITYPVIVKMSNWVQAGAI